MRLRVMVVLALCAGSPAHAEWWEARTEHFIVYSETSSKDARAFAERLERYDQALRSLQNIKPTAETDWTRVTVFRTGKQADIGRLAGGGGVAGFYIPRHSGPVAFSPAQNERIEKGAANADRRTELDPQTVLFHEYAHHFMYRHFSAAYPSWYREGFAEAYSTIDLKGDGSFHLGNAPLSRGSAFSSVYFNYSVQRMLQTADKPDFEDVYGRYTYGWLLTHYLTFDPGRQGQLQTYLKLINAGTEPAEAAQKAFGDLRKLESDVKRYRGGELPGALVRPASYTPPSVAMRRLSPDEEAIIQVKMRSKVGVTRKKAGDVAADARAIATKYPQSFATQLALTEAEFDAENWDAAERAADAALAIRPDSVEALQFKGRVYLERGGTDPKHYATARIWLAKAHDADPAHPSTLYYHYLTYSRAGAAIPESAVIGLEQSFMKSPYDEELRLAVVRQLLAEKDGKVARQVLAPLVHSPHESKGAKALRQVFDLIEANKVDEAYSGLVAELAKQEEERKSGKERD